MLLRSLLCSSGALLTSAAVLAQDLPAPTSPQLEALGTTAEWVRAGGAEPGASGAVQVCRPGFKAELSTRGFEMTPFRGAEAARSLPWAWTATEVRRGDQAFDATRPAQLGAERTLAWLDRGDWSERYELRADGIEQSFLFYALPGDGGDLVVRGAIETELRAEKRAARHAELSFVDERGETALTYGSALAIDARGRRLELATSFDGTHLEIRVAAEWLAEAALPLLVDPLVAGANVPGAFSGSALRSTCVALDGESSSAQWLVGVVRAFSATDLDLAAYLCDTGFANPRLVYLDASTATSDHSLSAAYLPAADRWIFSYQRDFAATGGVFSSVRLVFHDRQNTSPGTGAVVSLAGNPTHSYSAPQLTGGSLQSADLYALVTFQSDATTTRENTASSLVRASYLDAVNRTAATPIELAVGRPAAGFDRERPSVIPARFFQGEQWICVWTERPTQAGGKAKLVGTYVNPVGAAQSAVDLYTFPGTRHVTRPLVAGMIDHYVVVFGGTQDLAQTEANELFAVTMDWNAANQPPVLLSTPRRVAGPIGTGYVLQPIELDHDEYTFSHAAVVYLERGVGAVPARTRARAARLGGTGGLLETVTLFESPTQDAAAPSVMYSYASRRFAIASGAANAGAPVELRFLLHPTDAVVSNIGGGCGPAFFSSSTPLAGDRTFSMSLYHLPPNAPALLWFSLGETSVPLAGIGLQGCTLRVDPASPFFVSVPLTGNANGEAPLLIALPDAPPFVGDVYVQGLYVSPGANALNLLLTDAGQISVR